jgi:uncharacterized protein YrrD
MVRYEQVKGLKVVTINEGKEIGKVDDLFVDPEARQVRWLRIHTGGLFGNREWVMTKAVHGVGANAFMINGETDIHSAADAPAAEELAKSKRRVIGAKAMTENGRTLGTVEDYEFDEQSFAVTALVIPPPMDTEARRFIKVPIDQVVTIGTDAVVVTAEIEKEVDQVILSRETAKA